LTPIGEGRNPDLHPNARQQVLAGEYFQNFYKMSEKVFLREMFPPVFVMPSASWIALKASLRGRPSPE
jgi:hypothetical protein